MYRGQVQIRIADYLQAARTAPKYKPEKRQLIHQTFGLSQAR